MNLAQKVKRGAKASQEDADSNGATAIVEVPADVHGNHLLAILNKLPTPVAYITADHCYSYVNQAYADCFGLGQSDIVGKPVKDFLIETAYAEVKPYMDRALNGETVQYELWVGFRHGNRLIAATYTPDIDAGGNVPGYVAEIRHITDERDTEKQLLPKQQETDQRYRNLVHSLPAAVYTTDKDGYILMYNQAAVDLWGRQPQVGRDQWCGAWKIFDQDGITQIPLDKCPMAIALREKRKVVSDHPYIVERPDGERRYFLPYPQPMYDSEGNMTGGVNMLVDVTKSSLAEEEKARLAAIVQSSDDAIVSKTLDGIVTSWNAAAEKLFGYSEKEMIGHSITKIIPADRLDEEPEILARLRKGEKVDHFQTKRLSKDGSLIDVSLTISPVRDSRGLIIGASKIARDISERKKIEEINARLAAIVQSSDDAIIGKTLEGIVTSWNAAAEKLFGYTEQEIVGKSIALLIPEDRIGEEYEMQQKLSSGQGVRHFETKRVGKDGRISDVSLTSSPVKDEAGNIIGASKIVRDITMQNQIERLMHENEERFRMASAATQLGTWEFNPLTKKLIWSDESKEIYGLPRNFEPDSEFVTRHTHPDDRDFVHEQVQKAMNPANDNVFQLQYRFYRDNDNQLRWLKVQGKVYFDSGNKPERFIGIMLDITDEKVAEQLKQEDQERFRMAVETTNLGTWEYNPHSFTLFCSQESRNICGLPADIDPDFEVLFNHIYEEDKTYFIEQIKEAINPAGKGTFDMQVRIHRYSDHALRWVHAKGKMFFDANLFPDRLIGTMLDVTEQKAKELELKENVELFQTMADNMPAMIWMSGTDKFEDYFNKTWLEFTGRTLEQESNEGWLEGVHADDVQTCIETYTASFKEQRGFYTEYRLRRRDGVYRWISDNSVPRFSPDGAFLGFISACIDIDDQKRFREKIQESELLFKTISNASPAALWMTNEQEENIFISDTWLKWTGKNFNEVIHRGWIESVVDEDREAILTHFRESFRERKPFKQEFRFLDVQNDERWGLTEGYPFYDFNNSFSGYAGSVTDITEIKKLEQRKDDFIKMASHELKTPITSINGYVQLLLNIYNEADEQRLHLSRPTVKSSLNTISKQVIKLTRLITELLDLSKIESGKLELNKTEFDLCDLVDETVQDVRQTASKHAIIVHCDFEGKIFADKDRVGQVLMNLLTNAIKYSPDAHSVEVYVEGNKKMVTVRVRDYGIGIDKKDHIRIFERFYRAEGRSEQTFPGFGIGLFIASEIVQRHQGMITVESEKGKGSVFTVTLPVSKVQ